MLDLHDGDASDDSEQVCVNTKTHIPSNQIAKLSKIHIDLLHLEGFEFHTNSRE